MSRSGMVYVAAQLMGTNGPRGVLGAAVRVALAGGVDDLYWFHRSPQ